MNEEGANEMSSNSQETIVDIVADIRAQNQGLPEDSYALSPQVCDLLSLADRIDAAHKREMADEKRISDAVIQSLRDKKLEMAGEIAAKDAEIANLRALVKELSNVAERFVSCKATDCEIACGDIKENCIHKKTIELVAKAREAIGGTK